MKKYDKKPNGKNATGRPSLYPTPELFDAAVEKYFADCKTDQAIPTWADLVMILGYYSQGHIKHYCVDEHPEFIDHFKRAKLRVMAAYSQAMANGKGYGPGLMFLSCNLTRNFEDAEDQYINPQRIELTGPDGGKVQLEHYGTALAKAYGKAKPH
jgi:hypothetical protein